MSATKLADLLVSEVGILDVELRFAAGGDLVIEYGYETEDATATGAIRFEHVATFRYANESHSQPFPREAYDAVAEVTDSEWLRQCVGPGVASPQWPFLKRHFSVFLSNSGHLEVIAERFEVLPGKPRPE